MKILALERELPGASTEQFKRHSKSEAARAWELYQAGVLRELYFRATRRTAVLILECKDPPVMFPEPGGLTFEEVLKFLSLVWASGRVVGMSIACYHPMLDTDGNAGGRLATLLSNVLSNHK
jgi:hypothetical protein